MGYNTALITCRNNKYKAGFFLHSLRSLLYMKGTLLGLFFLFSSFLGYSQCTLNASITSSSPNLCPGSIVILTASASAGTAPYSYIWSTGETTPTITINKTGSYTVTVSDKTTGCQPVVQQITITNVANLNPPTVKNIIVCRNTPATFTATAPGGDYQWYDAPVGGNLLGTGSTFTTQNITQYTVFYVQTTISGCTSARSIVATNVISNPVATGDTVCSGSSATLSATGSDSYAWYDAATGGNLLSSSSTFTTSPLTNSTYYFVIGTKNGCTSATVAVLAKVTPPAPIPTASNVTICSGSSAHLHANASSGIFDWFDVPTGGTSLISSPDYTTPALTATTTYYVQTSLDQCSSTRIPVTVTVNPNPTAPTAQIDTICPNSSIMLTASTTPSGTYQWYDAPTGGSLLSNTVTYTTPVLNHAATYYVQNSNSSCTSSRTPISVIINTPPNTPSVSEPLICTGSTVTLTATAPGGIYQWYDKATGGTLLATDSSYTTPILTTTTTYYVQTTVYGCVSPRKAVKVTILAPVAGPKSTGASVCSGNAASLTASGFSSYTWYDKATGGNYLSSGANYITPALTATTTYYVQGTTINGCATMRTAVTVTVDPTPAAPKATSGPAVCPGLAQTLTASAGSGTFQWYDAASNGNLLATGATYTTPPLSANTVYYVENISPTSCTSQLTSVIAQVISIPSPQFQYSSGTYCVNGGGNQTPKINNPGGTFSAIPTGLTIDPSTGTINTATSTPGKYQVSYSGAGTCTSTSNTIIVITTKPDATFAINSPVCQDGTNPVATFTGSGSAGVFTASSPNLVFFNASTGEVNLQKSKPGAYTITNTISSGSCPPDVKSQTLIISEPIILTAGPNQSVPLNTPVQLAGTLTGPPNVTVKWTGGKGTFTNQNSITATYTPKAGETSVKLTLTTSNPEAPCANKSASVTITFTTFTVPKAPTAASTSICPGSTAVLTATAPGGDYVWYSTATGGTPIATGGSFTTPALTNPATYYVQTTVAGLTSTRTAVTVNITPLSAQPVVAAIGPICSNSSATLTASGAGTAAGTYAWYDAPVGGNLVSVSNPFITPPLTSNTSYYVQSTGNTCTVTRTKVNVVVNPLPQITSLSSAEICSDEPQAYTITSNIASANFLWKRAAVAGISNAAVSNQTSSTITETLTNTTALPINVTYLITPLANSCSGTVFSYVVTVNPKPYVKSAATATVCYGISSNYTVQFNDPTTTYTWTRAAVPGIKNSPVSGQTGTIQEVLFNTTNAPINVTYVFNYQNSTCDGKPFNLVVTVNPQATITSPSTGVACSNVPQSYAITSNIPSSTFIWSRAAVAGISNPAVSNQTTSTINEALINTSSAPIKVNYIITPTANGCTASAPFTYTATVNFVPAAPATATSTSPVCLNSSIQLSTNAVANAKYLWTGPNGFTSTLQNPIIDSAAKSASGVYSVYLIINGCTSPPTTTTVQVDDPPVATAGADIVTCLVTPSVVLNGTISGGTTTGIWTTAGTGTFLPEADLIKDVQYIPSAQDIANKSVVLTLASTSKDNCSVSTSSLTVTFKIFPGEDAGKNITVCSQTTAVQLKGSIDAPGASGTWTGGTGNFLPNANSLNAVYVPSAADIKIGSVKLYLTNNSGSQCYYPTDSVTITFMPPPTVNAGGTRYVLRGSKITLTPTVSDPSVKYLWTPNIDINDNTVKNPVIIGDQDITYTLLVTDSLGCTSTSSMNVIVSPQLNVPNAFTPNGDGINDQWNVVGLVAYYNATIDVFDRYGSKVFHSVGYNTPWDGTYNGSPLPMGVYYYVIDTKVKNQVISGSVTIVK